MSYKKHFCFTLGLTLFILIICAAAVIIVDPFFHYHKPLDNTSYMLLYENQRYVNEGILKKFDYNAIITGSSMTENFKASECDSIYGVKSVKVPYYGSTFCEINQVLQRGFAANKNITTVIRGLDFGRIIEDKDAITYSNLPYYIYDNNAVNDVNYVLNKNVLFNNVALIMKNMLLKEEHQIDFDEYCSWTKYFAFSKEAVLQRYKRSDYKAEAQLALSEQEKQIVKDNIEQNVIAVAKENPQTTFYCFYTPYSIVFYDSSVRNGTLNSTIEAAKYATELILQQENIKLFSFTDQYDMICDLNNFKDEYHYHEDINSEILRWMKSGKGQMTKENYIAHFDEALKFYKDYNYDAIFE